MDKIKAQLKAIVAAVLAALAGLAYTTVTDPDSAVNPDAPVGATEIVQLPNTTTEWVTLGLAVLATYLGVYGTGNQESSAALRKKLDEAVRRESDTSPPTPGAP